MQSIIKQLKQSKIPKEKKWLYSYTIWLLENIDQLTLQRIQIRLNMCFNQSTGYYKNYYQSMKQKDRKEYSRLTSKRQVSDPKILKKQKNLQKKMREIFKLYNRGELSDFSNKKIEEVIR
jgi:hypothetical protein